MATEKILNTRIQLKYDTLANWNASTIVLKTGELAIVTLGSNKDGSVAGAANQHPVLFKVGNNEKTFKDLPFASALAADVYAWAKAENVQLSGKTIQFVNGDTVVKSIVLDYITEGEVNTILSDYYTKTEVDNLLSGVKTDYEAYSDANLATAKTYAETKASAAETAAIGHSDANLATAKTYAETKASAAEAAAKTHAEEKASAAETAAKSYADAEILKEKNRAEGIESGFATRIGDLETAIGENGSVTSQISSAIEALDSSASQTAGDDGLALSVELVDGKVTSISGSIAAETYDAFGAAAAAESAAKAYTDEITTPMGQQIFSHGTSIQNLQRQDMLNLNEAKGYTDQKINTAKTDLEKEIDANTAAIALLVDSTTGDDTKLNSIKELATWIEEHGEDAAEMAEGIKANADAIAQEAEDRAAAVSGVQEQIDALGIENGKVESAAMADKADSLTDNAKAEVKAVKVDNATNADDAAKLGGVAAADYALKTDAEGYAAQALADAKAYADQAELDAVASAKTYTDNREAAIKTAYEAYADQAEADAIASANANTAEVIKNYYTKAEADTAFMDATETGDAIDEKITALNLATTYEPIGAESRAKAYADELAGNYATAAQGAKADSALQEVEVGTGLKVSAKVNNKQTIEIDPDVVFVFNCGSASVLVD